MSHVIVFGSLNMDLSIESERMPVAGETIAGTHFLVNPGGKGANQAVAASKLGARTYMIGAAGADAFGDQMVAALASADVRCDCIERVEGASTGVAVIVRVDGDNRIVLDAGANAVLTADDVRAGIERLGRSGDIFLTQLECDHEATFSALRFAHERGLYTMFNPAPARKLPDDLWPSVDLVCMNETECEIITGILPEDEDSARRAMSSLVEQGVGAVLVTLGAAGSMMYADGQLMRVQARCVNAIDTTCAGDTYIGALAAARAGGMGFEEAMDWATCASAITTTRLGAQQAVPSVIEVQEMMGANA